MEFDIVGAKDNHDDDKPLLDPDRHLGSFSHASLGSWGVIGRLAQAGLLLHLGLMIMEDGTVSRWRRVPPW
jgi:hypothetical protein